MELKKVLHPSLGCDGGRVQVKVSQGTRPQGPYAEFWPRLPVEAGQWGSLWLRADHAGVLLAGSARTVLPPPRIVDGRRASLGLCHQGVRILVSLHHFHALLSLQAICPRLASFHQAGVPLSCSSQSRLSP